MDTCRNIYPITFEPVRKLLIAAYRSGDFSSADAVIVRNTVKQTAMVWKLMNGAMDAYCWSSGRAVAHVLSRTSHPGYMLQLTSFVRGHATGDTNIKHAGELRLPDGACAVGVEHAGLGIESELAERFGIYITPVAYEQFGRCGEAPESYESVQLRVQNFLEKAKEDLVHHSAAWVVKKPERSPVFVDCHAIEDPSLDRGWDLQVTIWSRGELDAWTSGEAIQERGALDDAYDAATFAESFAGEYGAAAMIPYNVFEEVVDEHDTNYLIALAISIDQLPECVTDDEVSRRIRLNADQDMDERRGLTVREQDAPSVSLDELAEVYGSDQMEADEVEVAPER